MPGSHERSLEGVIDSLRYWEDLGMQILQDQIRDLARALGVDEGVLRGGTQQIKGTVDLSSFRKGAVNWALKTEIKKILEERNPQTEVGIRFTTDARNIVFDATNIITATSIFTGRDRILYSDKPSLNNRILRYRPDQRFEALKGLFDVIESTFTPLRQKRPSRLSA